MKIFIVTQNAPVYLAEFLENFLTYSQDFHIEGITCLAIFDNSILKEIKNRYYYYGFIDFLKMFLYILWNKFLSVMYIFNPRIKCYSVNNVIKKYNLKKFNVKSINSNSFIDLIKLLNIDVIVSIAAPEIFKKEVLSAPLKLCINYHLSLLPKYRGRQPLFWALLNNEKEIGISIHEMDEKLDNGPIIVQQKIKVENNDSLHSLYKKTLKVGPKLLIKALNKISEKCQERIDNNKKYATFYTFPNKSDAKLFKQKGKIFFNNLEKI